MTSESTHDAVAPLLGAYALDAVDSAEAAMVEAHLEECPVCRDEVAGHRGVAAHLAHSYEEPPAGLWERISEAISADADPPALRSVSPVDPRAGAPDDGDPSAVIARILETKPAPPASEGTIDTSWSRRRLTVALAAAVLVVVALAGVVGVQQSRLSGDDDPSLAETADAATSDPGTRSVELVGDGMSARAVVTPQGQGYLFGDDLPTLGEGRAYQLWSVTGGDAVSLGVLGASPDVVAFVVPPGAEAIAITDEPESGVAQPSGEPLAVAALAA